LLELTILGGATACLLWPRRNAAQAKTDERFAVAYSDAAWRKLLSPAAYEILRQHGTEAPYSSPLDLETRSGLYSCLGCGQHLYSSATKYDSHTGWPSFWKPLSNAVATSTDYVMLFPRTEVHCRRCGGHLGHRFEDGPAPTGLRYCINGVALKFTAGDAGAA
jgi:peptide-methionine (R)-S-oxide reductase